MKNRIITISREFGSGGRTIGKKTAENLGIPCYDTELIQKMALESGFSEEYIKESGEDASGGFISNAFTTRTFGPTNEDILWRTGEPSPVPVQRTVPCPFPVKQTQSPEKCVYRKTEIFHRICITVRGRDKCFRGKHDLSCGFANA